jgi:cobalt-precorrin 5A hydrolase
MGLDQAMIVAGIGCRKGVSASQVEAAIQAALLAIGKTDAQLNLIATPAVKAAESGIVNAAAARGIGLRLISEGALQSADRGCVTHSPASLAAMQVQSAAEAAALAGAGPASRLLGPRVIVGSVTCALAEGDSSA